MTAKIVAGALYAALLAVAALAYADERHGFPEPKGFRDVPWGASEETLRFRVRTQSCDVVDPTVDFGTRRCVAAGSVTFGHVTPNAVFFYFRNDMLVAWQISAHPRFRETLARSLMAQYGKPTVVYKGDHVTWKGRTCDLDFVGGAVQDTIVAVTKAELMTREVERRDRAHRAATRP
ncbi:MAG TPA: hypothetical protein VGL14_16220 [Methylomirabilota bacterium]|jgi:hypothetical protein